MQFLLIGQRHYCNALSVLVVGLCLINGFKAIFLFLLVATKTSIRLSMDLTSARGHRREKNKTQDFNQIA